MVLPSTVSERRSWERENWTSPIQTEMDMRGLDFLRFDDHLRYIEKFCGIINATAVPTLEMCQNYFAGLTVLIKLWIPLLYIPPMQEKLRGLHKEAKVIKRDWELSEKNKILFPEKRVLEFADLLDEIHDILMSIKQLVGMGQPVKKVFSTAQKIKLGMGRGKKEEMPADI